MRAYEVAEASGGLHRGQLSRPSWWCHERHWYAAVAGEIRDILTRHRNSTRRHVREFGPSKLWCGASSNRNWTLAPKLRPIKISLTDRELLLPFAGAASSPESFMRLVLQIGTNRLTFDWLICFSGL